MNIWPFTRQPEPHVVVRHVVATKAESTKAEATRKATRARLEAVVSHLTDDQRKAAIARAAQPEKARVG